MTLINAAHYPAVRACLDVSLDGKALPDDVISLDVYQALAEASVLALDPLAATRTGTDALRVQSAAVFFTASRIAPAMPAITSETVGDASYSRKAVDWWALAASLRAQAAAEILVYLDPVGTLERPTFFSVASASRGR